MKRGALGSGTVNEVTLYLLLKEQFSGEVDARTAEIELGKFRWEPFKKDGLSVMAFQTTIDQLLRSAQKTSQFDRIRCIRNALPQAFRDQSRIFNSEKKLWKEISLIHVTMECDKLDRGDNNGKSNGKSVECSGCGRTGHTSDICQQKDKDKSNTKEGCTRCGRGGHLVAGCYTIRHKDGTVLEKATKPETQTGQAQGQTPAQKPQRRTDALL